MNVILTPDHIGHPGATLRLQVGEHVLSHRLSIATARRLRDELTLALGVHDAARAAATDTLVARSDANALDALKRALAR